MGLVRVDASIDEYAGVFDMRRQVSILLDVVVSEFIDGQAADAVYSGEVVPAF